MPNDNVQQTITLAGSDTTENVMAALAADMNADANYNKDPDNVVNVLSVESSAKVVPGDANCATITYKSPPGAGQVVAPNGSSAGRNALKASVNNGDGCIDIARSSGPPRSLSSDLATFKYVAFGMDALGWASASTKAPANLTLAQFRGIYNCTFTNWNQVGGSAGPIQRYYPQSLSGTWQFFLSDLLGGADPRTVSTASCPPAISTQENTGELIAANADQEKAIVGYSAANWVAQARGTAPDQRVGQTMRSLDGQNLITGSGASAALNTAGPVRESNITINDPTPDYVGIRYVFNVFDETHVNYLAANRLFGFENRPEASYRSPLCKGEKASIIANYGFAPLDTTVSARNQNGSTCREYTP
jgi:phosphate transport system substrate-binding protein